MCLAEENDRSRAMHIQALMLLRCPMTAERVLPTLQKLFAYDRFRCIIVKDKRGHYWFQDLGETAPLLPRMLHESKLGGGDAMLHAYQERIMFRDFDPELPPWECHLLHDYAFPDGGKGTAIVFRIDHSLGDGTTLVQVLLSLTESDGVSGNKGMMRIMRSDSGSSLKGLSAKAESVNVQVTDWSGRWTRACQAMYTMLWFPFAFLYAAGYSDLCDAETGLRWQPGRHEKTLKKRIMHTREVPLAKIKAVAVELGGTINDVLMSAAAGWTRRWGTFCPLERYAIAQV